MTNERQIFTAVLFLHLRCRTTAGLIFTPHLWTGFALSVKQWRPGWCPTPIMWWFFTAGSVQHLHPQKSNSWRRLCVVMISCVLTGKQREDGGHRGSLHALQQDISWVIFITSHLIAVRSMRFSYLCRQVQNPHFCVHRADQALTTLAMRKFCEDKVSSSLQPSQNRFGHLIFPLLRCFMSSWSHLIMSHLQVHLLLRWFALW